MKLKRKIEGTYRNNKFTAYGTSKSVNASLAQNSDSTQVKDIKEGKTLHGTYKNGIFTPFPSPPSNLNKKNRIRY